MKSKNCKKIKIIQQSKGSEQVINNIDNIAILSILFQLNQNQT
jgi:hypothetical protein